MTSKMCEWDQFVVLDPEEGFITKLHHKKNNINPSRFYYGNIKYSDINPLEALYEDDEYKYEIDNGDYEKNMWFKPINNNNANIENYVYWSDILVKSIFTGCMVCVLLII